MNFYLLRWYMWAGVAVLLFIGLGLIFEEPSGQSISVEEDHVDQLIIEGPCKGVLQLPGEGDYVERSTRLLLSSVFSREEMTQIEALAEIPDQSQPTSEQVHLGKRLSYVLLYFLRKDIKGAMYDRATVGLSDVFSRLWGGYKWGPCSGGSFYLGQMLNSIGFSYYWLGPAGHTAIAIKLGAGALFLDSTFSVVHFVEDIHELASNNFVASNHFHVTDSIYIDGWSPVDLDRYYSRLKLPETVKPASVASVKSDLSGLPINLPGNASLVLDYSGQDTSYVIARFAFNLEQVPEYFSHQFLGRLHNVRLQGYMDAQDSYRPGVNNLPVKATILPANMQDYYYLPSTLTLEKGVAKDVPLDLVRVSKETGGKRSALLLLKNLCTFNILHKSNQSKGCGNSYDDLSKSSVKVEVLSSNNKIVAGRSFNCFTSRFLLPFETATGETISKIRLELTEASQVEKLHITNFVTNFAVTLSVTRESGVNEYFPGGQPTRFFTGGYAFQGKQSFLPYGLTLDLNALHRKMQKMRIVLEYRLSSTAFPFLLGRKLGENIELEPHEKEVVWSQAGRTTPPYKVLFSSWAGGHGRVLGSFMLADAIDRPAGDTYIVFPGLFDSVQPLTPYYSKDTTRPGLMGRCSPNANGVITLLAERFSLLPKAIRVVSISSGRQYTLEIPWEEKY